MIGQLHEWNRPVAIHFILFPWRIVPSLLMNVFYFADDSLELLENFPQELGASAVERSFSRTVYDSVSRTMYRVGLAQDVSDQ